MSSSVRPIWYAIGLSILVGATPLAAQGRSPASLSQLRDSLARVGGRVIVVLKSSTAGARLRAPGSPPVSSSEMGQIRQRLESRPGLAVKGTAPFVGALFARVDSARLADLNADPNVAAIEVDRPVYLQSANARPASFATDALRSQDLPWGVSQVTAPAAWTLGSRGAGISVGILDTGGDPAHPDLNWAGGYSAITGGTTSSDWNDNIPSCVGHGTHVAGTVAALDNGFGVVGVAPDVSLYALKVFEDIGGSCGAWISSEISALQWAVSQHIRVVNVSVAGDSSAALQSAVDNAAAAGTFVVAAVGNDNGAPVTYPAAYASVIAVASLDVNNNRSVFSNIGPQIMVSAPGENIESTLPGGLYGYKTGTSMAAPHVTGVVALLLAQNPTLTLAAIRQELQSGALDVDAAGFDQNTGWGLVRAYNSIESALAPTVTLVVAPGSRNVAVQVGGTAPTDNAAVALTGANATTTAWTATKKKSWTTLTTAGGTGSGTVAWSRNATGLAIGTYVDTITVTAPGAASGSPATVYDTLRITSAGAPVALALSPSSRNVSVQQGSGAPTDNATVTLTGTNATTTAWTATKKKSWTTLTTASGTGSGTVAWSRSATGLAVGTYVDTISVTAPGAASGSPATVYDTLQITASSVPVALALSPSSRNVSVLLGGTAPTDNATVTLTGTNATTTAWTATKRKSWTTLTTASGTGSGMVAWSRSATGLAVGTYVDTISVTAPGAASGSPATVYDTLQITAANIPVVLAVSPSSRNVSVQQGNGAPTDNATVALTGTNATTTTWTAAKRQSWTTLSTASGTGSGAVTWSRNATGLGVGTYVDTITVTAPGAASGSPATVYDTLRITAASVPVALVVSPSARNVFLVQGGVAPGDNASVTLTGTNATTTAWTATKRQSWTVLTTANGTGNGTVAWSRNATGLGVGIYIDTITVTAPGAAGGSPAMVIDTIHVTATAVPIVLAVAPASRNVSVQQGNASPADNAAVMLNGTNASTTAWTATKQQSWTVLTTASGTGNGTVAWSRNATGLAVGTYVDTITVTAPGAASGSPATIYDTLRIMPIPVPVVLALAPSSRNVSVQLGGIAPAGTAAVTLTGTNASSTAWAATKKQNWTLLSAANGTGSGTVTWIRNVTGLVAGTYVDTITVTAGAGLVATVVDSVRVVARSVGLAISPGGRRTRMLLSTGAPSIVASTMDSAVVADTNGTSTDVWVATTTASRLQILRAQGPVNSAVVWQRLPVDLPVGLHVDSVQVQLQSDSTVRAFFVDSLDVVSVAVPLPDVAMADLFSGNALTPDQRTLLDRLGNNNGSYDLGDFLAWVDRAQIHLSASVVAALQKLTTAPAVTTSGGPPRP